LEDTGGVGVEALRGVEDCRTASGKGRERRSNQTIASLERACEMGRKELDLTYQVLSVDLVVEGENEGVELGGKS
jgi:hypothetical protein